MSKSLDDLFHIMHEDVAQLAALNGFDCYRKSGYYIIIADEMGGMCKTYSDNPNGYSKAIAWMKKCTYKWKDLPKKEEEEW